jgi:hypothetical protein
MASHAASSGAPPSFLRLGLGFISNFHSLSAHGGLNRDTTNTPPHHTAACHPEERLSAKREAPRRTRRRISTIASCLPTKPFNFVFTLSENSFRHGHRSPSPTRHSPSLTPHSSLAPRHPSRPRAILNPSSNNAHQRHHRRRRKARPR